MIEFYLLVMPVFGIAILAAIVLLGKRATVAQERAAQNKCLHCGYDLRGSRLRCPECGVKAFRRLDFKKLRQTGTPSAINWAEIAGADLNEVVYESVNANETRLLSFQLQLRGIPARRADDNFPGQPFLVLYTVRVREVDRELADHVVEEYED